MVFYKLSAGFIHVAGIECFLWRRVLFCTFFPGRAGVQLEVVGRCIISVSGAAGGAGIGREARGAGRGPHPQSSLDLDRGLRSPTGCASSTLIMEKNTRRTHCARESERRGSEHPACRVLWRSRCGTGAFRAVAGSFSYRRMLFVEVARNALGLLDELYITSLSQYATLFIPVCCIATETLDTAELHTFQAKTASTV